MITANWAVEMSTVTIQATISTVSNNTFQNNTGVYFRSGLSVSGNFATVNQNTFFQNAGSGLIANCTTLNCVGNTYNGNSGNGIFVQGGSIVTVADNLVISNTSSGIYISAAPTNYIVNNTIYGNSAANGGGLYYQTQSGSLNYVDNNIIWGNTATGSGGDVYIVSGGSLRSLYNNDYHSMAGLWDVAVSNIDVAPLFVDAPREITVCAPIHSASALAMLPRPACRWWIWTATPAWLPTARWTWGHTSNPPLTCIRRM